jgi:hypothetical protein
MYEETYPRGLLIPVETCAFTEVPVQRSTQASRIRTAQIRFVKNNGIFGRYIKNLLYYKK